MRKWKAWLFALAVLIGIGTIGTVSVTAEAQNLNQGKRVLFISSYSYGWDTVQTQIEGIKAGVDENTTIDYEFMDTKRFRTDEWLNMFHDMLKYHLENTDPYDVVIVGDDAALQFEAETSIALGFGFRCGFLGLLHLEIIQERLEREYNLDLVTTAPSVIYKVHKTDGEIIELTNPTNLPDPSEIEYMEEPVVKAEIMVTSEFIGAIMDLCQERRGVYQGMEYIEETRAVLHYHLPLNEIIYDFFDALKSRSRGYASFDYELLGYEQSDLVKLDILINREEVDALSFIVHSATAYERGRKMCEKLKQEIPRQLFEIPIQAAIGSKIIARETVKAMRKDVLAKCYGGDISRKKKLLEKQKEGKKRMRQVGNVEIPQKAFMSVLKLDDN